MFNPNEEEEPNFLNNQVPDQNSPPLPIQNQQQPAPPPAAPTDPKAALIANYLQKKKAGGGEPSSPQINNWQSNLGVALAGLGDAYAGAAGRQGGNADQALSIVQNAPKLAQERQQYQRTLAQQSEMDNPSSGTSKQYQSLAAQYTGKGPEMFQGMSATKIANVLPIVEKAYGVNQETEAKKFAAQTSADARKEMAQSNLALRGAMFGEKQDQFNRKEFEKIIDQNNPTTGSSRTAIGQLGAANIKANRALTTLQNPMVTNQELGNVMADIASIYQGGAPTSFGMSHQAYNTMYGNIQGIMQTLSGKPQDAVPNAIKQRIAGVLNDMKSVNQSVLKQNFDTIENTKKASIAPYQDEWKNFRQSVEGNFGPGAGTGNAPQKPKTVKQNGHIYTLNEQTGKYE